MRNRNARLIIPSAVVAWALAIAVFTLEAPSWVRAAFVLGFVLWVLFLVLYLLGETGWRALARAYPLIVPFRGAWTRVATGNISPVSLSHPDYQRRKARFVGTLLVGVTEEGLYLSTLFSGLPLLKWYFPPVQLPWESIAAAWTFEAPGWVSARSPVGLVQASYDPNYRGTFVEIQTGEPPVFLQLPMAILGELASRLPPASGSQGREHGP